MVFVAHTKSRFCRRRDRPLIVSTTACSRGSSAHLSCSSTPTPSAGGDNEIVQRVSRLDGDGDYDDGDGIDDVIMAMVMMLLWRW